MTGPVGSRAAPELINAPVAPLTAPKTADSATTPAESIGPLPRGGGRRDEQRAHQHHADGLESDHDRDHDQGGEADVERADREALHRGEVGVEAEQLELLPEDSITARAPPRQGRSSPHVVCDERRGLPEEKPVEAGLAGVRLRLDDTSAAPSRGRRTPTARCPSAVSYGHAAAPHNSRARARVPSHPASAAPRTSTSGALLPVSMNAMATPGRAAWVIASPSRLCRAARRTRRASPRRARARPSRARPSAACSRRQDRSHQRAATVVHAERSVRTRAPERYATAVGAPQVLVREHLVHRPRRDPAHVEQEHPVEVLRHGLEIVVHHEHRLALRAQRLQQLHDGPLGRGVDALERLVHQVDPASWTSARARNTRCCWPPESWPICRSAKS